MSWRLGKLRPAGALVLVRVDERVSHYGAIEIPDEYRRYPQTGTVLAVGPGAVDLSTGRRDPLGVEPGERVVFGKWNGTGIDDPEDDYQPQSWAGGDARYRLMNQGKQFPDIYGVIDDAPATIDEYGAPQLRALRGAA